MKDVLRGDSAKAQLELSEEQIIELERKIYFKDSIINNLKMKEINYQSMLLAEKEKFDLVKEQNIKLEKSIKRTKFLSNLKTVIGSTLSIAITYLIITK